MSQDLLSHAEGRIHRLTFNRPERRNALTPTLARELADAVGAERIVAAVDTRGGHVVIHGWRTTLPITAAEAVRALEPYCAEFLCTIVDGEGMMRGIDMAAVREVRAATTRRLVAAGGITTRGEIDALDAMGVDAVVGMAIYTGKLSLE